MVKSNLSCKTLIFAFSFSGVPKYEDVKKKYRLIFNFIKTMGIKF